MIHGFARRGYTTVEVKVKAEDPHDLRSVREQANVLKRVLSGRPPDMHILADMNQTWGTAKTVILLVRDLVELCDDLSLEQPVPHSDLAGLREITASVPCAVIGDEVATGPEAVFRQQPDELWT